MDKTLNNSYSSENTSQSHNELETSTPCSQPHTEESVEDTGNVTKSHKRKRFTKAETREHLDLIAKAVEENKSITMLRHELGISETKLLSYIAELALRGDISLANYSDNVFSVSDIQKTVVQLLGITDMKNTLLKVEAHESGLMISTVPSSERNI